MDAASQGSASGSRAYARAVARVRSAGLRPTRQRLVIARLLFERQETRHVTAEQLFGEVQRSGAAMSLATVYNTLHQFTDAGLLQRVTLEAGRIHFDTNMAPHHHLLDERTGEVIDVDAKQVDFVRLPGLPGGARIDRIDIVIRITSDSASLADNDNG